MKYATLLLLCCLCGLINAQQNDKASPKHQRDHENLKKDHAGWKNCILISGKDSVRARIKPQIAYTCASGWNTKTITIAYTNEGERELLPTEYSALIIDRDTDIVKFISIPLKDPTSNGVYKVIVEGECQLLYAETVMHTQFGPANYYKYYLRYKNKVEDIAGDDLEVFGFKKKCRKKFADCPVVVGKIERGTYKSTDLKKIVEEFNQCLNRTSQEGN